MSAVDRGGDVGVVVPTELDGERLDRALATMLAWPRGRAGARIDAGDVTLDGVAVRRSAKVTAGSVVVVSTAADDATELPQAPGLPPIRWQDEHLLVVAKPAGMVVHAGIGHRGDTLVDALLAAGVSLAASPDDPDRPGIVHRLDRDTSGLLAVAKTEAARAGLAAALKRREVSRRYLALVQSTLPSLRGRIDSPLGRHPEDRTRYAVVSNGRPAVTHWEVAGSAPVEGRTLSLVGCRLETGRTHQIRVHLSGAGCPVVADQTYGASSRIARSVGLSRLFLHASRLGFDHPVTGEHVTVVEPLPPDLINALEIIGLVDAVPAWAREL